LGAHVIANERSLDQDPQLPQQIGQAAGPVDVLLLHLALPAPSTLASDINETEWRNVFAHLADPMPRLVAAVLPQMMARRKSVLNN
jgi:2-keto-3-deoxy-L-fuconate dehydrogenase